MVSLVDVLKTRGKAVSRGQSPRVAAMLITPLDFTVDLTLRISYDMSNDSQNKWGIAGIQSVLIDNSDNPDTLKLTFDNGLVLVCPAYAQAILPVPFSGEVLALNAVAQAATKSTLYWLNTREQAQLWTAKIPVAGTVNVSGSTVLIQKINDSWDNASVALAAGTVSQQVLPVNANRKTLAIRNPGTAASQGIAAPEPIYVSFGAAAAVNALGTWELFPGEQLPLFDIVTTESVWINAITTGHRVTIMSAS